MEMKEKNKKEYLRRIRNLFQMKLHDIKSGPELNLNKWTREQENV